MTTTTATVLISARNTQSKESIDTLLHYRGELYKGEVFFNVKQLFSLSNQLSSIIRAFEFSAIDKTLDCTRQYFVDISFTDRFSTLEQRLFIKKTSLILFDIKSKISLKVGDQDYSTNFHQRQYIIFYLCIYAANLSYVELILNFH